MNWGCLEHSTYLAFGSFSPRSVTGFKDRENSMIYTVEKVEINYGSPQLLPE